MSTWMTAHPGPNAMRGYANDKGLMEKGRSRTAAEPAVDLCVSLVHAPERWFCQRRACSVSQRVADCCGCCGRQVSSRGRSTSLRPTGRSCASPSSSWPASGTRSPSQTPTVRAAPPHLGVSCIHAAGAVRAAPLAAVNTAPVAGETPAPGLAALLLHSRAVLAD